MFTLDEGGLQTLIHQPAGETIHRRGLWSGLHTREPVTSEINLAFKGLRDALAVEQVGEHIHRRDGNTHSGLGGFQHRH